MAFIKYIPKDEKTTKTVARIRPTGLISFDANSVAEFDLDQATHAFLFFDAAKKHLGVMPTTDGDENGAFALAKRRKSATLKAPGFFFDHGLVVDKPMVFNVAKNRNDMLILDLKRVHRKRGRRPQRG